MNVRGTFSLPQNNQDLFIYFIGAQLEVNIALGKKAYQSTTGSGGVAALAVDGITDDDYSRGSCTHTVRTISPWWMVDLGRHFSISHLRVFNRDTFGKFLLPWKGWLTLYSQV